MKRGSWHQLGHNSQNLVEEQLEIGNGVGAIFSPSNLSLDQASMRAEKCRELGADVLVDPQFYVPSYQNKAVLSYEIDEFRKSVSQLSKISDQDLDILAARLESINRKLGTTAVVSPGIVYEAARNDIVDLNTRLFMAAKRAAESLGVPVYGTIVLGQSITGSDEVAKETLSHATSVDADGWYFALDLEEKPIPKSAELVYRFSSLGLTLAGTGLPILNAFSGITGLLSFSFGADAVAFGHTHNLRHFTLDKWNSETVQGGSGQPIPPRYFSEVLWGTIVLPDETIRLSDRLWSIIESPSKFGPSSAGDVGWDRWTSNKHYLEVLGRRLQEISETQSARTIASSAIKLLQTATEAHNQIAKEGIDVADQASRYQGNWIRALNDLLQKNTEDYDYLEMIGK